MARSRALTEAEKAEIAHLREEKGWSAERIARKIGRSSGSVSWALLAMGAEKPGDEAKPMAPVPTAPSTAMRCGKPVRRFTVSDDDFILRRAAEGLTPHKIGRLMDPARRHNSIIGRMRTLGRRQAREEARG